MPQAGPRFTNNDNPLGVSYQLGPGDVITVDCLQAEEFENKVFRIDNDGFVTFPLVGQLLVSGSSIHDLSRDLTGKLKALIRAPIVSITVKEFHSQPVSVLGAVNSPGVHQLDGPKSLSQVLALAGGLREDAGYSVTVTRQSQHGRIPVPGERLDVSTQFSVVQLNLDDILHAENPRHNIQIVSNDVVTVPKAELVYVVGDVTRAGGFTLSGHRSMSVLQALSLSEGLGRTAAPKRARILRPSGSKAGRDELRIDIKQILDGHKDDQLLYANDILFVPSSTVKKVSNRAIEAAITTASGVVIWNTAR